jgi:hypothetical protein
MTAIDLDLAGLDVFSVEVRPDALHVAFMMSGSFLEVSGVLDVRWPSGESIRYDARVNRDPQLVRLLDELAGASVATAVADEDTGVLDVSFRNGLALHYEPTDGPEEEWESNNPEGIHVICGADNSLIVFSRKVPTPDRTPEHDDAVPTAGVLGDQNERLLDLNLSLRVYGVSVFADAIELLTWDGTIFFAGPFTLASPGGGAIRFDPADKAGDVHTGAVLERLIDHEIALAAIAPETSGLTVQFRDGTVLRWAPPTPEMGKFRARHRSGWEFHSKGDGTVYWYGGPAGEPPKFLVGGPLPSD